MDLTKHNVLVTGASGFVGRNLVDLMRARRINPTTPTRAEFDLREQTQVRRMLERLKPEVVFHLAGLVGGIGANRERPADFNYENLIMGTVMLHESWRAGVKKYITLLGGCSYPAAAPNPIKETTLFEGYPQAESAPYSLAKAMGVVQASAYRAQYGFNAICPRSRQPLRAVRQLRFAQLTRHSGINPQIPCRKGNQRAGGCRLG